MNYHFQKAKENNLSKVISLKDVNVLNTLTET